MNEESTCSGAGPIEQREEENRIEAGERKQEAAARARPTKKVGSPLWAEMHGHAKANSPEYRVWRGMRYRCNNPNSTEYADYGGRGIKVCSRWDSFMLFLSDMGPRPEGKSINRIDNDGNYEPSNCEWATSFEQNANTRSSVIVNGKCACQIAREVGVSSTCIYKRIRKGQPLTAPGGYASRMGDLNHNSKLTSEIVKFCREEYARNEGRRGIITELANRFGVFDSVMGNAIKGKTWRNVK